MELETKTRCFGHVLRTIFISHGLRTYGQELLEVFHEWRNNRLPGIKFTKNFSSRGIEFLNSFVYCGQDNKLQTKPYSKACDEHTYLVPTSCHPAHNIRNILYSIGHTIYRIASEKHE